MSLLIVYGSTNISSTHLPLIDEKNEEKLLIYAKTLLLREPKHASQVLLNSQQMLALVLREAEH